MKFSSLIVAIALITVCAGLQCRVGKDDSVTLVDGFVSCHWTIYMTKNKTTYYGSHVAESECDCNPAFYCATASNGFMKWCHQYR